MSTPISVCVLIVVAGLVCVLALVAPELLSNKNVFLFGFVGDGLLSVLGVIVTITLASAGQLHLSLNQIEEKHQNKNSFVDTRTGIRRAAFALIWLFVFSVALVIFKPILATNDWSQTLFNGTAILVVVWNVLILTALTEAVFALKPDL
ncbi:hypothetical protein [Aquamicrobium sp. LC103]|uniref:hypothetical protein n=1 Tax=Aquamicrobium sp. LC103 TaxID=1120658 RepID=UPI00063EB41C|nr:hypothetical protein [Aquamicrobium sp. LC103]TKT80018.1 hypothetical protein XW59_006560 [Aquamicrobium sp. LC103]